MSASEPETRFEPSLLVAESSDVRPFARLLRGIGLKHNAVLTITTAGFEVVVEEAKSLCATAWIPRNIFDTFLYPSDEEPARFEISLDALLQCLNIFGNAGGGGGAGPVVGTRGAKSKRRWAGEGEDGAAEDDADWRALMRGRGEKRTGMRMVWDGEGHPLSILLRDEKGPVTKCELFTLEPEEATNMTFDEENRALYLIMKSDLFRDALMDLPPSCARVTLRAIPGEGGNATTGARRLRDIGCFSMHAEGDFGTVQLDYPNEREVMDAFECDTAVTFSYHAAHVALLGRALQHSIKICLQIETTGLLSVQVMMPIPDQLPPDMHTGILDFKLHALEDEEE